MTKKIISFISLCLISSLFLVGCQTQDKQTEQSPDSASQSVLPEVIPQGPAVSEADMAAYSGALKTGDPTFCDKIQDQDGKDKCKTAVSDNKVLEEAIKNIDASLCSNLSTEDKQEACKIEIEVSVKENEKNAEDLAEIEKNSDLFSSITENDDKTNCAQLKDPNLIETCEIKILTNKAIKSGTLDACDESSTEKIKQACQDNAKLIIDDEA